MPNIPISAGKYFYLRQPISQSKVAIIPLLDMRPISRIHNIPENMTDIRIWANTPLINVKCHHGECDAVYTLHCLENLNKYNLAGVEITKIFSLSIGKVSKILACPVAICVCPIHTEHIKFQNFCLSFGKVSKIFTCPPLFLPVPDRWTVSNFHTRFSG